MLVAPDALLVLVLALLLDAVLGDPDPIWRRWPHPVAWMGALIGAGDRALNREGWPAAGRRAAGAAWLLAVGAIVGGLAWGVETGLRQVPGGSVGVALAASVLLAQRSLYDHVARVSAAFASDGLGEARTAVAAIVGRDPDSLDAAGIARAAIETTAENFSDGVVAPAFWFAVAGLPGLAAYKAVNTADSMIGHLSLRHRDFGWASARLDDLLNLAPARLSGLLLAAAAPVAGGKVGRALRVMLRDAGLHRSPNAGWPEAAMAGGLGLALGGPRLYAAGPVDEPFLNAEAAGRPAVPADIDRALRVMLAAAALHGALWLALALLLRG